MKFVHAADLHLDSPLRGLERYEGAPALRVRGATRRALVNLVDLCLAEQAAFLLLCGDIYDGDWRDHGTGLYFVSQMVRLRNAGIPVYVVRGNHDAASQITKLLTLPDNVHEFSTREPQTYILEQHGVALHGQGFASRAVTEDLAARYPTPLSDLLNVGLLHTAADGREGHEPYAPCNVGGLASKGYDYWALGHVHAREVLATDPWVVFPGNLQGRHARETGPKGATVVTIDAAHRHRVAGVEARALDVVRWTRCDVDAGAATSAADAVEMIRDELAAALGAAEDRLLAAPVTLRVTASVHRALLADAERWISQMRAVGLEVGGDQIWIERVRFACVASESLAFDFDEQDVASEFARSVRALQADETELPRLAAIVADLVRKLPPDLRDGADGLRFDDVATMRRLLAEAESLVLGRLQGGRGQDA